jgi:hypothetical protein
MENTLYKKYVLKLFDEIRMVVALHTALALSAYATRMIVSVTILYR